MARLVSQMSQSLDGFVDHQAMEPGPVLFRWFTQQVRELSGGLYGRRIYELMQYWEVDDPAWNQEFRDFAAAWRALPKWVASRSLKAVGANATLVDGDLGAAARALKAEMAGDIEVGGPNLTQSLTALGLVDEYRIILRPLVLGRGAPYFAGPAPPLRLVSSDRVGEDAVRLVYAPA